MLETVDIMDIMVYMNLLPSVSLYTIRVEQCLLF